MNTINDLIAYENECVYLDFKLTEYKKGNKHELAKDVMAMANSKHIGDKYIIIGLKKHSDNTITYEPVTEAEDSASIQQYIIANIKPDIDISYEPYEYEGNKLAILTIRDTVKQPYVAKKDILFEGGKTFLKKEGMLIRKGSHTTDITREDLEEIYLKRREVVNTVAHKVHITFNNSDEIITRLSSINDDPLPSDIKLSEKKNLIEQLEGDLNDKSANYNVQDIRIKSRLIDNHKNKLESIKSEYSAEDIYFLYEKQAHKLQFNILNDSDFTFRDATFIIQISRHAGLHIAKQVYQHQNDYNFSHQRASNYPDVKHNSDGVWLISAKVGDIKHKLKHELLNVPLRIYFDKKLIGSTIILNCILHAENVPDLIKTQLKIEVVE